MFQSPPTRLVRYIYRIYCNYGEATSTISHCVPRQLNSSWTGGPIPSNFIQSRQFDPFPGLFWSTNRQLHRGAWIRISLAVEMILVVHGTRHGFFHSIELPCHGDLYVK